MALGLRALKDEEYRALLDLTMASDPTPLTKEAEGHLKSLLDREARARGHQSWEVAYHEFQVGD